MAAKGERKKVAVLLYRAYGQLKLESYLAPGTAHKKAERLRAQGYAVQIVETFLDIDV